MSQLKPLSDYQSFWEYTKDRSSYHFDKWRTDPPGTVYQVLGTLKNTWQSELTQIKQQSRPATWTNITYTAGGTQSPIGPDKREWDLKQSGSNLDLELTSITDDFSQFPELQKIINCFGLDRVQARCHVQHTGQMFTIHVDPLHRIFAGPGAAPDSTYDYDPADIVRITIMLEDWEPGQFILYGNTVYQQWQAGDFHIHDWPNVPHATANASHHIRTTLQITGLRTAQTNAMIGTDNFQKRTL